ncbi:DUF488 domain-containing protein, partial [Klebsiella pneumoniae]|uniref:DUF488 domain-containing protein n=1 Tax=Klebsiella pneumoniae TaxID=573 RepID=UPI003D65957B
MIQCKRVYDPQESSDGYRVLVDRLWPRGIKKEALACDEWCKELTPSAELRKAFHGEAIDFAHFSQRYRQELDAHRETGLGGGGRGPPPPPARRLPAENNPHKKDPGFGARGGGPAGG